MAESDFLETIYAFLVKLPGFQKLSQPSLERLASESKFLRYRSGQPLLVPDRLPTQVLVIYQGKVRLLGQDHITKTTESLNLLEPGATIGWAGLIRNSACEFAKAAIGEIICIAIPAPLFLELVNQEPDFGQFWFYQCSLSEAFDLLTIEFQKYSVEVGKPKDLALTVLEKAIIVNWSNTTLDQWDLESYRWFIGSLHPDYALNTPVSLAALSQQKKSEKPLRLIGIPHQFFPTISPDPAPILIADDAPPDLDLNQISYGAEYPPEPPSEPFTLPQKYPYRQGRGTIPSLLACFHMLSLYSGVPFRREQIQKLLEHQAKTVGQVSLRACGMISEMMGFKAQWYPRMPVNALCRLKGPALIRWQAGMAVLYRMSEQEFVVAIPESGIIHQSSRDFEKIWGLEGEILLLRPALENQQKTFSLRWFLPAIMRHRRILTEVLIASFFVQIFSLANPLITQVIVDKVIGEQHIGTLDILGILLVGAAFFEAILTSLRTYLFSDTTNRIDLRLGSEVIDRLLRLPLNYFEHRRVGELAGRINELESIRQFLTSTALTVVLDAVFSVIYIAIMFSYSWLLALVTLATIPFFALITVLAAPVVREQLHRKAERYADAQSYLVEVLSGIQTVKAQTIELPSRWQWQEKYIRYMSAGFKTVLTSSNANVASGFLNKLSNLLLLWIGAHLVLQNQLTLGGLIAFRIIAGYVTNPLLRLVQLWQNFQETGLSIERLGDILNQTPETEAENLDQISMPEIKGAVRYEGVSFRFNRQGDPQLINVHLDIPAGQFVGVVGQSGSGKSTLTKLLPRLYDPLSGRIQIDGYDISKVELYSLRRQIGMVLQDTLLFNTTVLENIRLTNPEASQAQAEAAARIAVADGFIQDLADGYSTVVGERGSSLSGGQRQRIAIARTILQNPRLLILDEATSALDYNTERQVCDNLSQFLKGRTVFFITHRLKTVRNADLILVMDRGTLAEQGTHDELIAQKGLYYSLYKQQEDQL